MEKCDSFEEVEILTLSGYSNQKDLESTIERFPNLQTLNIFGLTHRTNAEIISILSKCKQLKKLMIESGASCCPAKRQVEDEDIFDYKLNVEFHDQFNKTTTNPYTKIEFRHGDDIIGFVTKDEIVWRNKLLHWIGYNPIINHSVQCKYLLDLASIPKESKAKHKQPLNLIFNYLDLNSLYAFCKANKQCKQLVHDYVYQRCKVQSKQRFNQRPFHRSKLTLCDEFGINHNALRLFGKCINSLEIRLIGYNMRQLHADINKYCKTLQALCFRTRARIDPHRFNFPNIRHYIFYGCGPGCRFFCDLLELARKCPSLEILELRTPISLYTSNRKKTYLFRNLKKILFKPYDDSQVKYAEEFFKNTGTEVLTINK